MRNRRLTKSLTKLSNSKQEYVATISGTLGMPINGQKLVEVPGRNGYVYVKLRDNQSEFIQAYNSVVSNIYGLAVLVMRQGNIYKVIGRDQDRYRDWGNIPYLPRHGGQHSFNQALGMGADVTWIYSQQMMPLLGYPSGSLGSNGITVAPYLIRGLDGGWKYVGNTGTPDISMYRPTIATGAVMVLVYLDTVSGNPYLLVGSGSTFHAGLTGSADIAPYIPRSTNPNWIPDTAVRLTSGTTTLSWTNLYDVRPFLQVVPTGSSSGGGVITGSADSTYLRLDTTNDPLTGPLDIIPSMPDVVGLNIETLGDASSIAVTQRGSGSSILTPAFSFTREPVGDSVVTFSESAIEVVDTSGNSGTIIGSAFHYIKDAVTRMEINPNAQGTGTLALFDTAFTLSPDGLLLLLKNSGSSRFYVNASGTAYSNGVPLIKEAPVNGLPYVRRNAGWEIASTGTAGGTVNPPVTGSFVLQSNGQTLGSILALNVINPNLTVSLSGTVGRISADALSSIVEDLTPQLSGTQTRFTLSRQVSSNGILLLYNGVAQRVNDHFTVSGTIVDTRFTPSTGSTMQAVEMGIYVTGGSVSPEHAYFQNLAASLEPSAIYPLLSSTFNYTVTGAYPQMLLASFATRMGANGRMEVRHPTTFMMLASGTNLQGTTSNSAAAMLNPQLPSYASPRTTYYDRLNRLTSMQQRQVDITAPATAYPFLLGAYGGIIIRSVNFDMDYISIQNLSTTNGLNLDNEINDGTAQRVDTPLTLAVNKLVATELYSGAERSAGVGRGTVVFVLCPSDWSAIPDNTSYIFRDDFMGPSLLSKWSVTGSAVQINPIYQWTSVSGTTTWGANGAYSQTSFSRVSGTTFLADVYTGRNNTTVNSHMIGFSDRSGHSYTNFSHGVLLTSSGAANIIKVYENGNDRGAVGSGYSNGVIYRVRITITGNNAKYEIQGGAYGALGGVNWTNITPGTTSSSTTPLGAGMSVGQTGIMYVGDVRVY